MENEKRLIDANALKSEFDWLKSVVNESSKGEVMDVMQRIDNAPTVDAVEVVRCKDCKHYEWNLFDGCHVCIRLSKYVKEDFFCSYGEKRERA